jgi:hypothetical protein
VDFEAGFTRAGNSIGITVVTGIADRGYHAENVLVERHAAFACRRKE